MKPIQGALIGMGFAAAVFMIAMGCGQIAEWWKARKKRLEPLPLMRSAFRTTVSCGPDGLYEMRFKFRDLATMQAADAEWRAHVSGVEASAQPQENRDA
jgi:hypothetical protein